MEMGTHVVAFVLNAFSEVFKALAVVDRSGEPSRRSVLISEYTYLLMTLFNTSTPAPAAFVGVG
jgi:hypothetical protein